MTGGTVLGGIFGGCNTDGDVTGNSVVNIYGGTIGATNSRASIHGGGYGAATTVAGDVTVTFGEASNVHTDDLILYGDLYGGSALGTVNTSNANTTIVNVLNGIITGTSDNYLDYGNIFGGGLGDDTRRRCQRQGVCLHRQQQHRRQGFARTLQRLWLQQREWISPG